MHSPVAKRPLTIKVATNARPKPGGGKGGPALDWWVKEDCPADLVAFADLSSGTAWLMTMPEVAATAQQHSGGRYHLYMYVDPASESLTGLPNRVVDFERYLIERRARLTVAVEPPS